MSQGPIVARKAASTNREASRDLETSRETSTTPGFTAAQNQTGTAAEPNSRSLFHRSVFWRRFDSVRRRGADIFRAAAEAIPG